VRALHPQRTSDSSLGKIDRINHGLIKLSFAWIGMLGVARESEVRNEAGISASPMTAA